MDLNKLFKLMIDKGYYNPAENAPLQQKFMCTALLNAFNNKDIDHSTCDNARKLINDYIHPCTTLYDYLRRISFRKPKEPEELVNFYLNWDNDINVTFKSTEYPVFELYQDVEITHKLKRQYSEDESKDTTICKWVEVKLDQPLKGKIVGKRRLSDGVMKQTIGSNYKHTAYKTAYLVVTSIGRSSVKALPNRIKEQNETDLT